MKYSFYFFLLVTCLIYSCSSNKHVATKEIVKKERNDNFESESTLNNKDFFAAEKSRLLGDLRQAAVLYADYVKKHPENATAYYNLARLQLQRHDISGAEQNIVKAIELNPENKYYQELYAQILVYTNKSKLAENQFNLLIHKYPFDQDYVYDKAMLFLKTKEYDKAIETLNELEKQNGFNEDITEQRKSIYLKQGKTDKAIEELTTLKKADPSSPAYDLEIAELYETSKQKEKEAQAYKTIESEYKENPVAQVALARYYLSKQDSLNYDRSMQAIMKNRNLDVNTKISLLLPVIKEIDADSGQQKRVLSLAKSIRDEASSDKDAISFYADMLYFCKKPDEALVEYKNYLKMDSLKFATWSQAISIYSEKQQYDSVLSYSSCCMKLFPKNPIPYYYAGSTYLIKKEVEKSIPILEKGAKLEFENPSLQAQFYSSLGDAYNTLKNFTVSDSCFEKALEIEPEDATTLNNYAYYLSLRKARLEDAEFMSKRSLELQPNSKSFLDTYGWILYQKQQYKEALQYIQKAIDANGQEDGSLFEHIGDVYFKLNQKEKAIENWMKANKKGEVNPTLLKKIKDKNLYE